MAVKHGRVTVGTSVTVVLDATGDALSGIVRVPSGGVAVFLGDAAVATGDGYELPPGEALSLDLDRGERAYGVVATGSQEVHTLRNREE